MRLVDFERIEHRTDVIARAVLRKSLAVLGYIRRRIAACVKGNAAVALTEIAQLQFIGSIVAGKFVNEDDRNPTADFFVIELDAVVGCQMRHGYPRSSMSKVHGGPTGRRRPSRPSH